MFNWSKYTARHMMLLSEATPNQTGVVLRVMREVYEGGPRAFDRIPVTDMGPVIRAFTGGVAEIMLHLKIETEAPSVPPVGTIPSAEMQELFRKLRGE